MREVLWMRDSLVFFDVDLRRPWNQEVLRFDASMSGCGVAWGIVKPSLVRSVGAFSES